MATPAGAARAAGLWATEGRASQKWVFLRAMLVRSTYARHRIRHGIRHTAARAGRHPRPPVGGELLLSPQSVEIIKFGDPGSGR